MGFLVFGRVVLCDNLKAALVEKLLFFLFAENMLLFPFLPSAPFFLLTHSIEDDIAVSNTVYILFFSNHKLISSSQNSDAWSDTRDWNKLIALNDKFYEI